MGTYASGTKVSPETTQAHIRATLRRYGAEGFTVGEDRGIMAVCFRLPGGILLVRMAVPLPSPSDDAFTQSEAGRVRKPKAAAEAFEQAVRQRWRALLLAIKAKLEAVECGISTLETEFMPFVVCPDGQTIGEKLVPRLAELARSGRMPNLLALPAPES